MAAHDDGVLSLAGGPPTIAAGHQLEAVDIENQLEANVVSDALEVAPIIDHREQWYYRNYWKSQLLIEQFKLTNSEDRLLRAQQQKDRLKDESAMQKARILSQRAFADRLQTEIDEQHSTLRARNAENSNLLRIIAAQEAAAAEAATWYSTAMPRWTALSGWPPQGVYYTGAEYAAESLRWEQYSPVLTDDTAKVQLEKELNTTNDKLQVHPYFSPPYGT